AKSRIEMHLRSLTTQSIDLDGRTFALDDGEMIHTENSCKYSVAEFRTLAMEAGFECVESWTDDKDYFSIHYLRVPGAG
ncbi:MAG: L-histidine N(alpha)-methyltransferase, partial [Alphaproteobacteria bacterium]